MSSGSAHRGQATLPLHPEVPVAALLPCRISGSGPPDRFPVDDGGAHDGPLPQLQPFGFRVGVDFLKQSLTRFVFRREAAEVAGGLPTGQRTA